MNEFLKFEIIFSSCDMSGEIIQNVAYDTSSRILWYE